MVRGGPPFHPAIGVKLETTMGVEEAPTPMDRMAVLAVGIDSAGYTLADAVNAMTVMVPNSRRPGDTLFDHDTLDRLAEADCVVEDTPNGVTIHLPNSGGPIPGRALVPLLAKPLCADEFRHLAAADRGFSDPHDYLRHDPTKQHRRRRKRR